MCVPALHTILFLKMKCEGCLFIRALAIAL